MSEFNKLKSLSTDDIEKAISKTLSELTGVEYNCSISNIVYDVFEGAKIDISVAMKMDFSNQEKEQ